MNVNIYSQMKSLFTTFILIMSFQICGSQSSHQDCDTSKKEYEDFISRNSFNGAALDMIDGHKFLFLTTGHTRHIWSLAIPYDDYYILLAGDKESNDFRCDTVFNNSSTLKWGMDTLSSLREVKPVARTYYWPFHKQLTLFSEEKDLIFDYTNIIGFDCEDSTVINRKYKNLLYYMFYAASPEDIQQKLPAPQQ